jgi:LPS-assembly lipoprotein
MSSYSRRFALLSPLALAACGFAPVYGAGGAAAGLQKAIRVDDPSDKFGFDLVKRLEERLGRPERARYDLSYVIQTEPVAVGITLAGEITRYNLVGSVAFTLKSRAGGETLTSGKVDSFTAWSATGPTVAGLEAEDDARSRLMRILADQIVARLLASALDWAQ